MDQDFGAKNFSLKNQGKDQDLSTRTWANVVSGHISVLTFQAFKLMQKTYLGTCHRRLRPTSSK